MAALGPYLPDHCEPVNDFLFRFSSAFHICVPTPLALLSNTLGILSICAWLFAQLPQIYKNWCIQSTSGLSIFFLVEWCLGDLSNLLGALFTHQASWQVAIGSYYVFVDLCLVGQWIWFEKLKHSHPVVRIWRKGKRRYDDGSSTSGSMQEVVIEGMPALSQIPGGNRDTGNRPEGRGGRSRPQIIFKQPTFQTRVDDREKASPGFTPSSSGSTIHRVGPSSWLPSPSPRTVLFIACLVALAQASPVLRTSDQQGIQNTAETAPTPLEQAGTVLSWMSAVLYLGSRFPQLLKNWRRKSTAGLSPHLFIAAFCGNLFYSCALVTNPNAWNDFAPYGGGGWVGQRGNDRVQWVLAALPFFLGAAGVLIMDGAVGAQFLIYGEGAEKLIVIDEGGPRWHWRRVSGWMRGWVPSISEGEGGTEREALIAREGLRGDGYGAL